MKGRCSVGKSLRRRFFQMLLITLCLSSQLAKAAGEPLTSQPEGEKKAWSWSKLNYAPCEGFGTTGSYKVSVEARAAHNGEGLKINALTMWLYSTSFSQGSVSVQAEVVVRKNGENIRSLLLKRPESDEQVVEVSPGRFESSRLYLPRGVVVDVPEGAKLAFVVTVQVQTSSGSCSLGSSEQEVDPFEP